MKFKRVIGLWVGAFLAGLIGQWAFAGSAIHQAQKSMITICQKEYPTVAQNITIDQLDVWAEAQEHSTRAAQFRKTQCFKAHEAWERLAQRNEWNRKKAKRMPASSLSSGSSGK